MAPTDRTSHAHPATSTELRSLWTYRHDLPPDVLRTLADIWLCATASRWPGSPPNRFWDNDPEVFTRHDTIHCDHHCDAGDPAPLFDPDQVLPVYAATELLFERRHSLSANELRLVERIWCCASAARYGAPHEQFWDDLDEHLAEHNLAEC